MRKKRKSLTSLIVTSLLVVGLLSGCNGDAAPSSTTPDNSVQESQQPSDGVVSEDTGEGSVEDVDGTEKPEPTSVLSDFTTVDEAYTYFSEFNNVPTSGEYLKALVESTIADDALASEVVVENTDGTTSVKADASYNFFVALDNTADGSKLHFDLVEVQTAETTPTVEAEGEVDPNESVSSDAGVSTLESTDTSSTEADVELQIETTVE